MNETERGDVAMVLMRFFSEAKKEGTIGHGIKCLDDAVNEIDRLLAALATPDVVDDAVERAVGALKEYMAFYDRDDDGYQSIDGDDLEAMARIALTAAGVTGADTTD